MTDTDDRALVGDIRHFDPGGDVSRGWWWPLVAGGVALALVAGFIGRVTAPSSSTDTPDAPEPGGRAEILEPGGLLGPIGGASQLSADRYSYAWPGQLLSAPTPTVGKAVTWQWQTCDVPEAPDEGEEPAEALDCSRADNATEHRWESPPVNAMGLVRVVVTVDLGGGVVVEAASAPVAAMPWPANVTPGEPPPTTTTTAPPPPPPPPPPPELPPEFFPPA